MNIEAIDTFIERDEKKEASLQKKETPIETTSRHFREFNNNVPNFLVDGKK